MKLGQMFVGGLVVAQIGMMGFIVHMMQQIEGAQEDAFLESYVEPTSLQLATRSASQESVKIPFTHYVVGEGRALPLTDYVKVRPVVAGIVKEISVEVGSLVKVGDPLFQVDDSTLVYSLKEKVAECRTALAKFTCLSAGPSDLDLKMKDREIEELQIQYQLQEKEQAVFQNLLSQNAVSVSEKDQKDSQLRIIGARLDKVLVEYEKLKAGATQSERAVEQFHVREKEAQANSFKKMIQDCKITAPIEGRVLEIAINKGGYVSQDGPPALVLGLDRPLQLCVRVDEKEAWRISPTPILKAIAIHKSNPKMHFILDFIRVSPCIKQGSSDEGKLELFFTFDPGKAPIYLEQLLDVYIEAASPADTDCLEYQFNRLR